MSGLSINMMMRIVVISYLLLSLSAFALDDFGRYRTWTSADGRELEAVYYGTIGEKAELYLKKTKKTSLIPISSLSQQDQDYLAEHGWPLTKKSWRGFDKSIVMGKLSVSYAKGSNRGSYESDSFIVESSAEFKSVEYQEIFRQLEAFYKLMNSSPWGISVSPDGGKFEIKITDTKDEYYKNGGLPNSAGVYMPDKKLVMTYKEALYRSEIKRNRYEKNLSLEVLSHELAHLLMHDIVGITPPWFVEGVAEYIECIPIKLGKVEVDQIDEKALESKAFECDKDGLKEVFKIPLAYWQAGITLEHDNPYGRYPPPGGGVIFRQLKGKDPQDAIRGFYQHGLGLVYGLFADKRNCGSDRMLRYLAARKHDGAKRQKALETFNAQVPAYNKGLEEYNKKLEEFLALPEVESTVDPETKKTLYSYPEHLTPPEPPEQLKRLSKKDMMLNRFGHLGLLYSPDISESELLDNIEKLLKAKAK